jgi:phosphoesterase RecJ-like protein
VLNIDHHSGNPGFGDYNYVKILGAACSVFYELLKKWQIQPEKQVANALLIGIILDTGFYSYNSTTSLDFLHSSELINFGAEHYKITWKLTFNETEADSKLRKLVFDNLVTDHQKRVAYTTITLDDLRDLDLNIDDSYLSPSDLIKTIQGIDFAFAVKELNRDTKEFSISIRGHTEDFNCITLAKMLNPKSGGHTMAAGANIKAESIEDAVQIVIDTADKFRSQENS